MCGTSLRSVNAVNGMEVRLYYNTTTRYMGPQRGLVLLLEPDHPFRFNPVSLASIDPSCLSTIPNILSTSGPSSSASEPRPLGIHIELQPMLAITSLFVDASYSKCLRGGSGMVRKGFIDSRPSAWVMKLKIYWPIWHAASAAKAPTTDCAFAEGLSTFAKPCSHIQRNHAIHVLMRLRTNTCTHAQTRTHARSRQTHMYAHTHTHPKSRTLCDQVCRS